MLDHLERGERAEGLTRDDIEIEPKRVRRQLRVQAGHQPGHTLGLVRLDVELSRQLTVDRFDHLPEVIHELPQSGGQLVVLISPLRCE